jgi:hypothetical protein
VVLGGRTFPAIAAFTSNPTHRYFAATGHSIQGEILRFWTGHGGLPIFGYPLSEELKEDGRTVQYFERARLEWHPELADTGYGVLPSPLGAMQLRSAGTPAVTLEPPTLQTGHSLLIKVLVPDGATVSGTLDGRPLTFACCLPLTTAGGTWAQAWAVGGVEPVVTPAPLALRLTVRPPGEPAIAVARTVPVRSYPFPVFRSPYPYTTAPPSVGVRTNERDQIAEVIAGRSGPPRWQGIWQPPLAGPLQVNSSFGERRAYTDAPGGVIHGGVDLDAEAGVPILAPAAGRVMLAEPLATRGNVIMLDHGGGVFSLYAHQSAFRVRVGQDVAAGDVLGLVGATGLVTGPHLHWEVYADGAAVEPLEWLRRSFP